MPGPRFFPRNEVYSMNTIEIARRLAECGEKTEAQRAYTLALQAADLSPEEEL